MQPGTTSGSRKSAFLSSLTLALIFIGVMALFSPTAMAAEFQTASFTEFNCNDEWGPNEESGFNAAVPPGADYVEVQGDVRTEHLGAGYDDPYSDYYSFTTDVSENSNGVWELQIDITNPQDDRDEDPTRCQAYFGGEVVDLPGGEQRLKIIVQSNIDDNTKEYTTEVNVPTSDGGGDDGDDDGTPAGCTDEDDDGICDSDDKCIDYDNDGYGTSQPDRSCTDDYCSGLENTVCEGSDECPQDGTGHILTADGECVSELPDDEEEPGPGGEPGEGEGCESLKCATENSPNWVKLAILGASAVYATDQAWGGEDESLGGEDESFLDDVGQGFENFMFARDALCTAYDMLSQVPGLPSDQGCEQQSPFPRGFRRGLGAGEQLCRQAASSYREKRQEARQKLLQQIRQCGSNQVFDVATERCIATDIDVRAAQCANPSTPPLYDSAAGACISIDQYLSRQLPGPIGDPLPGECPNINY